MSNFEEFITSDKYGDVFPVIETMPADLLTPLAVYLKLAEGHDTAFLFESVEGGESLGRYSFIGAGPHTIVRGNAQTTQIIENANFREIEMSPMEYLREHFGRFRLVENNSLPGFTGGAVAMFNFSCAGWFEPSLLKHLPPGDDICTLLFFRSIVAFDHIRQEIKIISLIFRDEIGQDEAALRHALQEAHAKNRETRKILELRQIQLVRNAKMPVSENRVVSNWERDDFLAAVNKIKEAIFSGDAYQVVLSQCFTKRTAASPVSIYRAIRSLNPSPYMFLITNKNSAVVGASPEMLVRLRNGKLCYRPIAGTRPRSSDQIADERLAEEMLSDEKEVSEHLMLVDLGRNDLGRVARFGSVMVEKLMTVEKYSHVQHLVSSLSATIRPDLDRFDAFAACFPAGTVSGAPKVSAIEIISQLEPTPRGIYSGAVGYFDYAGNMDTCIAIRTMRISDGVARIQAGAGIVADSVPTAEYNETLNKAKALLRAIEIAESLEADND